MLDLSLREIEYVVEVATQRNFTRAAARLHMAQPALSQAILRIERRLGVPLFVRSSRHVELTAAGESLAREGPGILAAVRRATDNARQAYHSELTVTVHVSEPSLSVPREVVARLRAAGATVHQRTLPSTDVVEQLLDGRLTLAVGTPANDDGIVRRQVSVEDVGALMSVDHPLAQRDSVTFAELASYPMLSIDPSMNMWNDYVHHLFARAGQRVTWSKSVVFGAMASRDVLVDRRTVLITMKSIGADVQGDVVWVPFNPAISAPWYVNWSRDAQGTPAVRLVTDALAPMLTP